MLLLFSLGCFLVETGGVGSIGFNTRSQRKTGKEKKEEEK